MDIKQLIDQWPVISDLEYDCLAVEEYKRSLRFLVCRDYGWLVGELFEIEGDLGWGPGNRDWEDEIYPEATGDSYAHMVTFLKTLASVKKDTELREIIADAEKGKCTDIIRKNLHKCMRVREAKKNDMIAYIYGQIVRRRDCYVIGGARIYLSMWREEKRFVFSLGGLMRILFTPFNKTLVNAATALRRLVPS